MYFPQGFVSSVWTLGLLRFMIGISDGALFPTVQTLLSKNTPRELTGTIFSWNQSFQAAGSMLGSLLGGAVSGWFDESLVTTDFDRAAEHLRQKYNHTLQKPS